MFRIFIVLLFHGIEDKVVDIEYDRLIAMSIQKKGGKIKLTEFQGVGHDCKEEAYGQSKLWIWMFNQRRKR